MRKTFQRPPGHEHCRASSTIMDTLSFGNGELDHNGFWENGCYDCARAYEKQFPEKGECWPFSRAYLKAWERRDKVNKLKAQLQRFFKKSLDRLRRFW